MGRFNQHVRIRGYSLSIVLFLLTACASSHVVNDFFGIAMNADDLDDFVIRSYSVDRGVNYQSNTRMDPDIFAWAEIELDKIRIKIVNRSNQAILLDYNRDEYAFVTSDGKRFTLNKGDRFAYEKKYSIEPNASLELVLLMPSNFWEAVGLRDRHSRTSSFIEEFWRGNNSLQFTKENITLISVDFYNFPSIFMKPVPRK